MPELNFDANTVEPLGSFEPLPLGDYIVIISASEMKPTKDGKGQYLQLVYDVVDGEYKGRKVFDRLNLVNDNKTAEEIAQRALSSICRSVGVMAPKTSEELHNKPFMVKLGIRPAKDEFAASNVVKEYKTATGEKVSGTAPASAAKKAETAAPATAQPKNKKPWER